MSTPLSAYNGLFSLSTFKRLKAVPPDYEDALYVQQCCNLFHQRKSAALELQSRKGNAWDYVEGRLYFDEKYQYKVHGVSMTPEWDLDWTLYFGPAELTFTTNFRNGVMDFYLHAIPPEHKSTTVDFLVYKCQFKPYKGKKESPTSHHQSNQQPKYPVDSRLVGHWRYSDNYFSGGFSSYSETNLHLRHDGTFSRRRRSFTTTTFSDSGGNWAGMSNTDSGSSPVEYGSWGIIDQKFCLFYNGKLYYNCTYSVHNDNFLLNLQSSNQLWKKVG